MADPTALPTLAIVGGGPAGLMAAEAARAAGVEVDLYDRMGSVGRKFLVAGKGGLNLTHSDPPAVFVERYGDRSVHVARWLQRFDAEALCAWARGLGIETFVGSSGRVFPSDLKAAPLLRGWVRRLRESGVRFHRHHHWLGWTDDGALRFRTSERDGLTVRPAAVVFALGGGSWPVLGSDGAWTAFFADRGVGVAPLLPSNCGFDVAWTDFFSSRYAGQPLKPVIAEWQGRDGAIQRKQGECIVSANGLEGSLIYAASSDLRGAIAQEGTTEIRLDLVPGRALERLERDLSAPRGSRSFSEHLRRRAGIEGVKAGLLHEVLSKDARDDSARVAAALKSLALRLLRARPLEEAISSAGGVRFEALDEGLMLSSLPGHFVAGEMIDWEAPTGGYLLTACFASGHIAGTAAAAWLKAAAAP